MLTKNYLKLLSVKSVNRFCSKPYGFELLILLYNFTRNNDEYGIEETYEMIHYNKCKRPAFLRFVKNIEAEEIIVRLQSKVKKSRSLLRLNQDIVDEIDLVNGPDEL